MQVMQHRVQLLFGHFLRWRTVGQQDAQRRFRQVRPLRQEQHGRCRRPCDLSLAFARQPRHRLEQRHLGMARGTADQRPGPARNLHVQILHQHTAIRTAQREVVKAQPVRRIGHLDGRENGSA